MNNVLMRCRNGLLSGLISILITGCVTTDCPTMPRQPTKPALPSLTATDEGGITLNNADAQQLGIYILELERGYQ